MSEQKIDDNLLDEATEWFVLMRAEEISDQREQAFVQWISQSALHQTAYAEVGGFWDDLPMPEFQASDVEISEASVTSLADHKAKQNALQESNKDQSAAKNSSWSPRLIAASIAFLILTFAGLQYGDTFLMDRHSTRIGEIADIILEDGSHLVLNTNSEIRVDLTADQRIVYLDRGEAFFEVKKDQNRPFFVETAGGLVRVLGTKFNVRHRGSSSDVTVLEGSVGVTDYGHISDTEKARTPHVTLTPNQKFTLGNDSVENVAIAVDSAATLAWRDRKLIYNGESFKSLIADINRYYDGEIRIGDPALNDIEVVAILKIEDRATTLKAIEATFNVTARPISKDLITLYPNK
ncbi:MAG: FecR domain-containing protein [Emcibacter sp.]|nr:FecR domain-containing protein [Emcibacter sp.]